MEETQQISTWFAPALHKSYALNDRDGAYRLELARLERALSRYAAGTKLIEWGHKTSFAYITEKGMREELLVGLAKHMLQTRQALCSSCQLIFLDAGEAHDGEYPLLRYTKVVSEIPCYSGAGSA